MLAVFVFFHFAFPPFHTNTTPIVIVDGGGPCFPGSCVTRGPTIHR